LRESTTNELIRIIRRDRLSVALADPEVWNGLERLDGEFLWNADHLIVSSVTLAIQDYPQLWNWNLKFEVASEETDSMLISPVLPVTDALCGVKTEWNDDCAFDLELRYLSDAFVEAKCHDLMNAHVQIRGSVSELLEIKALVHCEGKELETNTSSCPQLSRGLTDIARMGPGIEGYHVLAESTRSHITHGEKPWIYWTTDLIHWAT
jgi:hypothetical protein